jgi:hypothetical protein
MGVLDEVLVPEGKAIEHVGHFDRRKLFFCTQIATDEPPIRSFLRKLERYGIIGTV